jgi:hypothetical protein
MTDTRYHLPAHLDRLQRLALLVGAIGIVLGIIGAFVQPREFFNAWHFAFFFVIGIPLGGLALTMLHHLTGGNWGLAIRRECEAAALTLPLMALLFLPTIFGTGHLFPWADQALVKSDSIIRHQAQYFNTTWFTIRAAIYFIVWIALAVLLGRWTLEYERTDDWRIVKKIRKISAVGLIALVVTISLASFDWVMSREKHFYSTIMGLMIAVGMTASALVLVVALLRALDEESEMHTFLGGDVLNDLGNLMLTLVILWAYMSFSQLLIVWMGNISHETPWYLHRGIGNSPSGWKFVALLLLIFHFFVPFFILLSRDAKRDLRILTSLALLLLVMRMLDAYWLIAPSGPENRRHVSWMDLPLLVGILGLWFAMFVAMLRRRPLVARVEMDEEEAEAARAGHGTHGPGHSHGGATGASPVA